jgi:hypothetical protein
MTYSLNFVLKGLYTQKVIANHKINIQKWVWMTMRAGFATVKNKKQLKSIRLVYMLVASSMLVVFPLSIPKASAQVTHLASAALEDMAGLPYDTGPVGDGFVVWDPNEDHYITDISGYTIEAGMTLNIPTSVDVYFGGFSARRIDVYGTLITNMGSLMPPITTLFTGEMGTSFDGIYFHSGSKGCILSSIIRNSLNGIVFEPGSTLMSPGITHSSFEDIGYYGIRMNGTIGYTSINMVNIDNRDLPEGIGVKVINGDLNMRYVYILSHGPGLPALHISNSSVNVRECQFNGDNQSGNVVLIEGGSNGTVLDLCLFMKGAAGDHYIRVDGSTSLFNGCSFKTSGGELSVFANEDAEGVPAHVIVRQPTADNWPGMWDDSFDNSTMNVTGNSSITLQWYMNVYVEDPDGNPIDNAPVWVNDRIGNPAAPSSKITDASGWARGFLVTELIQYSNSITNFNPFTVSAINNSMIGYAYPSMNMSKEVTVIVPFNPVPNLPPIVSFIQTPGGVKSGPVSIQFRLEDPNIGDDGNMSITVEFWDPIDSAWVPATAHPTSGPTTYLNNNTLYTFVWDSKVDFPDKYSTDVKIKITPYDKAGPGIPSETLNFTVDNGPPTLLSGPTVETTNTTAIINWTVHEPANASVWYGLDGSLTNMATGSISTTFQTVTLTGLRQGRTYTYTINSIDQYGNRFSSALYTFDTKVHIQLYKGWNMISIPPHILDTSLKEVLAPIMGQYDAVQMYDILDPDPWKHNRTGKPYGNDFDEIFPIFGLWIHMKNDALFILDHKVPSAGLQEIMLLTRGWNFVGYPSVTTRSVSVALVGSYDQVQTYDASSGQWLSYDGGSGLLTDMELGRGYWIHVTAEFTWQVDYV